MSNEPVSPLLDVLRILRTSDQERRYFARWDTAATLHKVRLLTAAAIYFNTLAVEDLGGRLGPTRGLGLVEQVVGAAFQTYAGEDPHPGPFAKAAMLLRGITQGHPFGDGNKRTGFLLAAYYLDLVGHPYPPVVPVEATVAFSLRISSGEIRNVDQIAADLERFWSGGGSDHAGN